MVKRESNVERLEALGVLDASEMSEEHKAIINKDMTEAEIYAIIAAHRAVSKLNDAPWKPDVNAFAF